MGKRRVLFLCTGNSCRSQMGEGIVNHLLGDRWEAFSAGVAPAGYVHPLAIWAMAEIGIDVSSGHPKPVNEFRGAEFDLVITVCDDAAENSPLWLGSGDLRHTGFPDPAHAQGSEEERFEVFRQVRNDLLQQVVSTFLQMEGMEVQRGLNAA
ncbi:MAG: arsenate reductase ArsC [Anaerolineae bacterium]|jgi:arsenate reductase